MRRLEEALLDLGSLDALGAGDGPVHRLDPRAKVLATLVFAVVVASYPRHELSALLPLALFPVVLGSIGGVPARLVTKKLAAGLPFVLLLGAAGPLLERTPAADLLGVPVSLGWMTLFSLVLKFLLTAAAALVLVGTTSVAGVASALSGLGAPRALVTQLVLLYRFAFVLAEDALRMRRARDLRSFGSRGTELARAGPFLGNLLVRTWERASRIHRAMAARGFDGTLPPRRPLWLGAADAAFLGASAAAFVACRAWDLPGLLGAALSGGAR